MPVDNFDAHRGFLGRVAEWLTRHRLPFTRSQAVAAGITSTVLHGPRFTAVLRGVYVGSDVPLSREVPARAALLTHPAGAYVSHHTAAELLGLPVPHSPLVHLSVFLDRAAYLDPVHLVVLGDPIVRRKLATVSQLVAAADRW